MVNTVRIRHRFRTTALVAGGLTFALAACSTDTAESAEQPPSDPPNLGLISSTEYATTWESKSLRGEADIHDLDAIRVPNGELHIHIYDAGKTFSSLPGAPAPHPVAVVQVSGNLVGIGGEEKIWASDGTNWTEKGSTAGIPEAFAFIGGDTPWVLIADDRGIVATDDYGEIVSVLVADKE